MESVRRQHAFVSSAAGIGTPYDYTVSVAPNMLECAQNEQLRVTLMSISFFNDVQGTSSSQTSLEFVDANGNACAVHLSIGNVPFQQIADGINAQCSAVNAAFDKYTNQLVFDLTGMQRMRFLDNSWQALGFSSGADIPGGGIVRGGTLRPPVLTDLVVTLEGVSQAPPFNVSNLTGGPLDKSNVLLAIPVDCPPFAYFTWESPLGAFSMVLTEKRLSQLRFILTDFNGNLLTNMPHHRLVLRFEIEKAREDTAQLLAALGDIKKYSRLSLLTNALNEK
jgi:hypothetical protein